MLRVKVVTLFPDWFTAPLSSSILGRAAAAGLVKYRVVQLRDTRTTSTTRWMTHRTVAAPGWCSSRSRFSKRPWT